MLNNNNEIWKAVKNFEGIYEVSSLGNVRNNRQKLLKYYVINSGYAAIKFTVNGKRSSHLIHRLVLEAFKPSVDATKNEVNHIDENKLNNCLDNLEWVSSKENKQHSIKSGTYDKLYTLKNSLGKKHLPNTKSKYHNVSYDKARNKWTACVRADGQNLEQKRFNTEKEAAAHVNYIIDKYNLTDRPKNVIV